MIQNDRKEKYKNMKFDEFQITFSKTTLRLLIMVCKTVFLSSFAYLPFCFSLQKFMMV